MATRKIQSMSVFMKMPSPLLAVRLVQMGLCSISQCQPVLVYLAHLMLIIELLYVLCVPSNNEQCSLGHKTHSNSFVILLVL